MPQTKFLHIDHQLLYKYGWIHWNNDGMLFVKFDSLFIPIKMLDGILGFFFNIII